MPRKVLLLLPALLLMGCFLFGQPGKPGTAPVATYLRAEYFFNSVNPTAATDSMALNGFEQSIQQFKALGDRRYDSLLFQSYFRKGILLDVKGIYAAATVAYLGAAATVSHNRLMSDSLLFRPFIYAGSSYFNLNNFDSANYFLIKAEALTSRFPHLSETERLYNTLGALHYVNGNYLQSRNYFSLALGFIKNKQPYDRVFALGLNSNIASCTYKLGQYKASLALYKQIVNENITAPYIYNGIWKNMGNAYAALGNYREALLCFKKINPHEMPGVLNELAMSYFRLGQPDVARLCLNGLQAMAKTSKVNILDIGVNDLYRGDMLVDQQMYMMAIRKLQSAINIFAGVTDNGNIYANPSSFSGSYTYYRLFDALYKKAQAFDLLNRVSPNEQYLTASLDAYNAAITLLSFIEKSYDTDDAKLFLKKKSAAVYSEALLICMRLHQMHPDAGYLEQAFIISEKDKASVMASNLHQQSLAASAGVDQSFRQTERNIKFAIARLDIKSEQSTNNTAIKQLAVEKAGLETELSRLQKSLEQNSHFFKSKYEDDFPSAGRLRQQLKASQALFSFYFTNETLHVFAFTSNSFLYTHISGVAGLQQDIQAWTDRLKAAADGKKFSGAALGQRLYDKLIQPMQALVPGRSEWMIIPDGELFLLPFESLPDGYSGKYLLETTTISYQFSSRFLINPTAEKDEAANTGVLSFAPFANSGAQYQQPGFRFIDRLPASAAEIAALSGTKLIDKQATKSTFLQEASKYSVIHLATHAMADVQNPAASFVAFYPEKKAAADNCLYLEEIYALNLDACKLVVISACETGKGAVINNEGVMSLGRAFAYAGCASTVNSLWKADDKATAFILTRFHLYLDRGEKRSRALQKAKIDYLKSDALYKNPGYWSNLTLTGNVEPIYEKHPLTKWVLIGIAFLLVAAGIYVVKKKKKKSTLFATI